MDGIAFWVVQGPGWLLFCYLAVAQGLSALDYELGVRLGAQEPASRITPVGAAFWWGLALADLVFYTPLLGIALAGHWFGTAWSVPALAAAAGITVYWPIASLATVWRARGAEGWVLRKERQYWTVLPFIALWGTGTLVILCLA